MIDVKEKYQASIFVNIGDILPNTDNITKLLNVFRDKELIPNTFNQLTATGPQLRLQLTSPSGEWIITFAANRIDVHKNPVDLKGDNLGELSVFCSDVIDFFRKIINLYKKKPHRIAIISSYMLHEMEEVALNKIYQNLFKSPQFYTDNPPVEWNWRSVSRTKLKVVGSSIEELNAITVIHRLQGEIRTMNEVKSIDRISMSFDINTIPQNKESRFTIKGIENYFTKIHPIHNNLLNETMEFING